MALKRMSKFEIVQKKNAIDFRHDTAVSTRVYAKSIRF